VTRMAIPWSAVAFLVEFLLKVLFGFKALESTLISEEAAATLSRIEGALAGVSVSFSCDGVLIGAAVVAGAAVAGAGTGA